MECTLVFDPVPYLLFITVFEFAMTFWFRLVNSFQKARVKTNLYQDYILDDTLDNETPNGDYINDNYDDDDYDENYINDNNGNDDRNQHNDEGNNNNFENDIGDQTKSAQILMCLHSVNPCFIYRGALRFFKNHRNESSRSSRKIHGEREEIHVGE